MATSSSWLWIGIGLRNQITVGVRILLSVTWSLWQGIRSIKPRSGGLPHDLDHQ